MVEASANALTAFPRGQSAHGVFRHPRTPVEWLDGGARRVTGVGRGAHAVRMRSGDHQTHHTERVSRARDDRVRGAGGRVRRAHTDHRAATRAVCARGPHRPLGALGSAPPDRRILGDLQNHRKLLTVRVRDSGDSFDSGDSVRDRAAADAEPARVRRRRQPQPRAGALPRPGMRPWPGSSCTN